MRYILFFLLLLFVACKVDNSFTIEGSTPNSSFNGEYVYMIPIEKYSFERVDSAIISNSSFVFSGKADSAEIFILRTQKPLSRFEMQDILVVTQPGNINVKFEECSSACGTSLNDSLQKWKEGKESFDNMKSELSLKISKADSLDRLTLSAKSDSLSKVISNFHYDFVKNNKDNVVGALVGKFMSPVFTDKQKREISIN